MNKKMYALGFLYMACDSNEPYSTTLVVSEDRDKIVAEMNKFIAHDCVEIEAENYEDEEAWEEDAWDEDWNYELIDKCEIGCTLRHRMRTDLYTKYFINEVECL